MFTQTKAAVLAGLEAIKKDRERVVVILTALVFAPLAAVLTPWLAKHFPGLDVSSDHLESLMVGGFLGAVGLTITLLRGRQKVQDRQSAERIAVLQSTSGTRAMNEAKSAAAGKVVAEAAAVAAPEVAQTK